MGLFRRFKKDKKEEYEEINDKDEAAIEDLISKLTKVKNWERHEYAFCDDGETGETIHYDEMYSAESKNDVYAHICHRGGYYLRIGDESDGNNSIVVAEGNRIKDIFEPVDTDYKKREEDEKQDKAEENVSKSMENVRKF